MVNKVADSKRYANHRNDLVPTVLVSKRTKWYGEKPHTEIQMPLKLRPTVHPTPSFARFCETRISQQRNKASITSDKRTVGTRAVLLHVSHVRWRTVNGTRTIERTFYQRFWFQRRRSETAESLIRESRCHQSFDPRCSLRRASRGSARHVFLVYYSYYGGAVVLWLAGWTSDLNVGGSRPGLSSRVVSLNKKKKQKTIPHIVSLHLGV